QPSTVRVCVPSATPVAANCGSHCAKGPPSSEQSVTPLPSSVNGMVTLLVVNQGGTYAPKMIVGAGATIVAGAAVALRSAGFVSGVGLETVAVLTICVPAATEGSTRSTTWNVTEVSMKAPE